MIGESVLEIRKIEEENQLKIDQAKSEAIILKEDIINEAKDQAKTIIDTAKKQGQEIIKKRSLEADDQVAKIEKDGKVYNESIDNLTDKQLEEAVAFVVERIVR